MINPSYQPIYLRNWLSRSKTLNISLTIAVHPPLTITTKSAQSQKIGSTPLHFRNFRLLIAPLKQRLLTDIPYQKSTWLPIFSHSKSTPLPLTPPSNITPTSSIKHSPPPHPHPFKLYNKFLIKYTTTPTPNKTL